MRAAFGILIALVFVNAVNSWRLFKRRTTPNPAMYCKDKDETFCNVEVPKGFCSSANHTKAEIKDRCKKSCDLCCFDLYPEQCKYYDKLGFCSFALDRYPVAEIKVLCGVTCKLCDD
ncbi:hypothetical protein Aduo_009297 [Ancylostoma duodenale]